MVPFKGCLILNAVRYQVHLQMNFAPETFLECKIQKINNLQVVTNQVEISNVKGYVKSWLKGNRLTYSNNWKCLNRILSKYIGIPKCFLMKYIRQNEELFYANYLFRCFKEKIKLNSRRLFELLSHFSMHILPQK